MWLLMCQLPEASKLLSTVAIGLSNCSRPIPHWISQCISYEAHFTMKLTYKTLPYDDDGTLEGVENTEPTDFVSGDIGNRTQWNDDCPWGEWYSAEDPVKGISCSIGEKYLIVSPLCPLEILRVCQDICMIRHVCIQNGKSRCCF